jgi:hypothetical protein
MTVVDAVGKGHPDEVSDASDGRTTLEAADLGPDLVEVVGQPDEEVVPAGVEVFLEGGARGWHAARSHAGIGLASILAPMGGPFLGRCEAVRAPMVDALLPTSLRPYEP